MKKPPGVAAGNTYSEGVPELYVFSQIYLTNFYIHSVLGVYLQTRWGSENNSMAFRPVDRSFGRMEETKNKPILENKSQIFTNLFLTLI